MLDIKEIKRRLGNGGDVELECIDRDGLLKGSYFENTEILRRDIIVESVCHNSIDIVGSDYPIVESEYKYFKIKEKSYTEKLLDRDSKFTELLSVATKAVNNGDLSSFTVTRSNSSGKIGGCLYIGANMTYHAIENEIKGLEMKEELEVKEDVSSECADRDKYLNLEENWHKSCRTITNLYGINKDTLELNKTRRISPYSQFKRFRIVEDKPTFDEVVDSAFKALKDGVIKEIGLDRGILMIMNDRESGRRYISKGEVRLNGNCEYLEYIDSLYTEAFVIDDVESLQRVKIDASGVLANGSKFKVHRAHGQYSGKGKLYIEFESKDTNHASLGVLKGATVTQQKGNK